MHYAGATHAIPNELTYLVTEPGGAPIRWDDGSVMEAGLSLPENTTFKGVLHPHDLIEVTAPPGYPGYVNAYEVTPLDNQPGTAVSGAPAVMAMVGAGVPIFDAGGAYLQLSNAGGYVLLRGPSRVLRDSRSGASFVAAPVADTDHPSETLWVAVVDLQAVPPSELPPGFVSFAPAAGIAARAVVGQGGWGPAIEQPQCPPGTQWNSVHALCVPMAPPPPPPQISSLKAAGREAKNVLDAMFDAAGAAVVAVLGPRRNHVIAYGHPGQARVGWDGAWGWGGQGWGGGWDGGPWGGGWDRGWEHPHHHWRDRWALPGYGYGSGFAPGGYGGYGGYGGFYAGAQDDSGSPLTPVTSRAPTELNPSAPTITPEIPSAPVQPTPTSPGLEATPPPISPITEPSSPIVPAQPSGTPVVQPEQPSAPSAPAGTPAGPAAEHPAYEAAFHASEATKHAEGAAHEASHPAAPPATREAARSAAEHAVRSMEHARRASEPGTSRREARSHAHRARRHARAAERHAARAHSAARRHLVPEAGWQREEHQRHPEHAWWRRPGEAGYQQEENYPQGYYLQQYYPQGYGYEGYEAYSPFAYYRGWWAECVRRSWRGHCLKERVRAPSGYVVFRLTWAGVERGARLSRREMEANLAFERVQGYRPPGPEVGPLPGSDGGWGRRHFAGWQAPFTGPYGRTNPAEPPAWDSVMLYTPAAFTPAYAPGVQSTQ